MPKLEMIGLLDIKGQDSIRRVYDPDGLAPTLTTCGGVLKLILLPVTVGISFEIIRYAGRYSNPLTRLISAPGLWLQRLTTAEPDTEHIEVAIASMLPCIPSDGSDQWGN